MNFGQDIALVDVLPYLNAIDFSAVGREYGTPFYIYLEPVFQKKIKEIRKRLQDEIKLYYAVKANPNPDILKSIHSFVDGFDISSGGELSLSVKAGMNPLQMSFAGPGKTDEELSQAVSSKVGSISMESINELGKIEKIAEQLSTTANVTLRINPNKIFKEFAIKMGGRSSQFGIDEESTEEFFNLLSNCKNCNFKGIHIYSGTQCLKAETLVDNFCNTLSVVENVLKQTDSKPDLINFGGGFGIPYHEGQDAFDLDFVCSEIVAAFRSFKKQNHLPDLTGIIELGRYLIAEAGIYVARVVDVKESRGKKYCVLDGGMNHHLPASGNFGQIFRKNYKLLNLSKKENTDLEQVTVVGPLCTSIDILGDNVLIAKPDIGDAIGILNSGAYAYTASPLLFLSHKIPVELLYKADEEPRIVDISFFDVTEKINDGHKKSCC